LPDGAQSRYTSRLAILIGREGKPMIFHVAVEYSKDGWFVAECPALPGCVSQGKDEKEALDNIKEAITAWLWAEDQKAFSNAPTQPGQRQIVVAVMKNGQLV
jgi:predicted RNase H-like HicB family nuclease